MASKTTIATAFPARNAATAQHFGIGDAASANPNCLFVRVDFSDDAQGAYSVTTWLETTSDGGATQTNAVVSGFTSAQINTLKSQLVALYNAALTAEGFV